MDRPHPGIPFWLLVSSGFTCTRQHCRARNEFARVSVATLSIGETTPPIFELVKLMPKPQIQREVAGEAIRIIAEWRGVISAAAAAPDRIGSSDAPLNRFIHSLSGQGVECQGCITHRKPVRAGYSI